MSILVGSDTRLLVQGITGREGVFHAQQMQDYGTNIVAGVTPGKGGQRVLERPVPVFDTCWRAVQETGANTSVIYVPAAGAADAVLEAAGAGLKTIFCITEHIPVHDMLKVVHVVEAAGARLVGPNCPGATSPGKAKVGIIPGNIHLSGRVGLVSRSGTLTYEVVEALTEAGIGQSTCVGIGGDPITGSNFIDILGLFRDDPETEAVVLMGEIGGDAEERAAAWIADNMQGVPMVAFIAGRTAPPGRRMGHAGAIISGNSGTAESKVRALEEAGVRVAETPSQIPQLLVDAGVKPS
ncbi:MAG TPA: succinate--CoA ligase subunit alpha [Candidatus Limnocylindria bacterium]|nr:succinate--CoA ligase subunit alpha [Candidatus Limnocylindria bacterium]